MDLYYSLCVPGQPTNRNRCEYLYNYVVILLGRYKFWANACKQYIRARDARLPAAESYTMRLWRLLPPRHRLGSFMLIFRFLLPPATIQPFQQ